MEAEIEKLKRDAARRRIRTTPGAIRLARSQAAEGGKRWAFIIAGAFILTLVAFVSGVWMGKALSDLKHRGESPSRAKLERKNGEKKESPRHAELKERDFLPNMEEKSPMPAIGAKPKEKGGQTTQAKQKVREEKVLGPAEEIVSSSTEEKKSSTAKARFTLQVAAFNNVEEAKQMVNLLQNKGYAAYQITGSAAAKGTWYRVRVGHFQSLQEARQFALSFEKKEKIKTVITALPTP